MEDTATTKYCIYGMSGALFCGFKEHVRKLNRRDDHGKLQCCQRKVKNPTVKPTNIGIMSPLITSAGYNDEQYYQGYPRQMYQGFSFLLCVDT